MTGVFGEIEDSSPMSSVCALFFKLRINDCALSLLKAHNSVFPGSIHTKKMFWLSHLIFWAM